MGILGKFIKKGVKFAGGLLGHAMNAATGGMAGKIGTIARDIAHEHSGILGKAMRGVGRAVLSDDTRNKLSKVADTALKYIPSGKTKDTLTALNNSAQNKSSVLNVSVPPSPNARKLKPRTVETESEAPRSAARSAISKESF